ncbi:MAG: hypothetical protein P4L66_14965 [Acetobacteraceae bacterium]|nr:hypothetical protein [Acetobacteraceae bacterium]
MSIPILSLGPVQFTDFELPASIIWGGTQSLAIHRMPGGARIIDAMGRDDAPISWSGIFSGQDAISRAHTLDQMRADGSVWPLSWQDFTYSVLIARFEADYRRSNWIPYRISCAVVSDNSGAPAVALLSASQSVAQDLAIASALSTTDVATPIDSFSSGSVDLSTASALAANAAQQATASFYLARAARNSLLG